MSRQRWLTWLESLRRRAAERELDRDHGNNDDSEEHDDETLTLDSAIGAMIDMMGDSWREQGEPHLLRSMITVVQDLLDKFEDEERGDFEL